MSTEKEGVRQMFGKSSGCAGKPEQDLNRGIKVVERTLLPEGLA